MESGSISIAGEDIVDPRVEMFAHPRSLSPSVRECGIRGSAVRDPGMSAQHSAQSLGSSLQSQVGPQHLTPPGPAAGHPRTSTSLRDQRLDNSCHSLDESPPPLPRVASPARQEEAVLVGQPQSGHLPEEAAAAPAAAVAAQMAEPVTRLGVGHGPPASHLTEEACVRHEELLQTQLLTTQQQLEELQRQYQEVMLGCNREACVDARCTSQFTMGHCSSACCSAPHATPCIHSKSLTRQQDSSLHDPAMMSVVLRQQLLKDRAPRNDMAGRQWRGAALSPVH